MVIKCSNRRQEILAAKAHNLNPIQKFMQLSLQMDASSNLQQDFHKSPEMWQK